MEYSRQNPPAKNAKQDPSWALGRKCASLIHSMQVLRSSWTVKCETYFNCGRPLENVWPRGRYQKNVRARENEMKKNHARQITLKTFTQRLQRLNKFIQGQCFGKKKIICDRRILHPPDSLSKGPSLNYIKSFDGKKIEDKQRKNIYIKKKQTKAN